MCSYPGLLPSQETLNLGSPAFLVSSFRLCLRKPNLGPFLLRFGLLCSASFRSGWAPISGRRRKEDEKEEKGAGIGLVVEMANSSFNADS